MWIPLSIRGNHRNKKEDCRSNDRNKREDIPIEKRRKGINYMDNRRLYSSNDLEIIEKLKLSW